MEKCVSSLVSQLLGRNTGAQVLSIFYREVITSIKEFADTRSFWGIWNTSGVSVLNTNEYITFYFYFKRLNLFDALMVIRYSQILSIYFIDT